MDCAKFGQVFNKYLFFAKKEAEWPVTYET